MKRLLASSVLVLATLAASPRAARAATVSNTLTVTATVLPKCTITAGSITFPDYDPTAAAATPTASTGMSITCTNNRQFYVTLDDGQHAASPGSIRRMANGTAYLEYNLCGDAACATTWANPGSPDRTGVGTTVAFTLYGQIPAGQYVDALTYSDGVTVTVNF